LQGGLIGVENSRNQAGDGGGSVRSDFKRSIHSTAAANHFRCQEQDFEVAAQTANNQPTASVEQLTPQAQERPKGNAGQIADVLQIDNHKVDSSFFKGQLHFLAQLLGGLLALDARLHDRQDEDALVYRAVQKRVSGKHGALGVK
jgi:hypothetical protein